MNRFLLTTALWLCALVYSAAQDATLFNQVVGSTGRFAVLQGRTYSYTVGEVVIPTEASSNRILTQGFHQPEQTRLVSVGDPELTAWDINVFPNPVSDLLTIRFSSEKGAALSATVVDAVGRVILTDHPVADPSGTALDCRSWQPGIYFLILTDPLSRASAMTRVIRL
ncbi:MAG: T9SS type A sorting domain-containing protein [Lewinellaceae bacterium]|nr:T9SS type A sorting domain-containing protein [Lewinellaceae bacterium]